MNTTFPGNPLIGELLADPAAFKQRGRAYQLLEEYFEGLPMDTLRPLLAHKDILVKHAAVWVASELGHQACTLLDEVTPLIASDDRFLSYHALEVTIVCAIGDYVDRFIRVPQALESNDDVIRSLAMRLLTRADQTQLEAAARLAETETIGSSSDVHRRGLSLLSTCESRDPDDVRRMLLEDDSIARMYGAIAAKRLRQRCPELLRMAAALSDASVSRFAEEAG